MTYSVSAWSYAHAGIDLFTAIEHAKKAGFDAIELLDLPCGDEDEAEFASARIFSTAAAEIRRPRSPV